MKLRTLLIITFVISILLQLNLANIISLNMQKDPILDCASRLVNAQHENDAVIAYFRENNIDTFVQEINSSIIVVDLKTQVNETTDFFKFPMYVILIDAIEAFSEFINQYSLSLYWNPRGRFVVVYSGNEDIDKLLHLAWKKYLVNIVVLILNNGTADIYTYFPYKNDQCGDDISKELLGNCETTSFEKLFPNKIPWKVNGCLTRVAVNYFTPYVLNTNLHSENVSDVGFEVVLIGNMLRRMNFTIETIELDGKMFSKKMPNGSYVGPVKYLYSGTSDLLFGHLWYDFTLLGDFDLTFPYIFDKSSWFVPSARSSQQWKSLILIFKRKLWLSVCLTLLCNILVWWIFGRKIEDFKNWKSISWCILYSCSTLLLVAFKLPRSTVLRLLVIFWVITGFLLATAYQSKLLSILTHPISERQITTLEELVDSEYDIVYFSALYDGLEKVSSELDRRVIARGKSVTVEEYVTMMKNVTNTGFVAHSTRVRYDSLKYHTNPDGTPKLYEFQTAVAIGPINMQTAKGYPFLEYFDKMLLWYREGGLIDKWIQSIDQYIWINTLKRQHHSVVKLSMNHFLGVFYLILFGQLLAFIVFLLECLCTRLDR